MSLRFRNLGMGFRGFGLGLGVLGKGFLYWNWGFGQAISRLFEDDKG